MSLVSAVLYSAAAGVGLIHGVWSMTKALSEFDQWSWNLRYGRCDLNERVSKLVLNLDPSTSSDESEAEAEPELDLSKGVPEPAPADAPPVPIAIRKRKRVRFTSASQS